MSVATKSAELSSTVKSLATLALFLWPCWASARGFDAPSVWTHALPIGSGALELLSDASGRSSIIEGQLKDLEKSDVVVYVTDLPAGSVGGPSSYLSFLSNDGRTRYLVVRIDRFRLTPTERIVSLGHELHHALEVAATPSVRDAPGLADLYRRIGREGEKNRFESDGAKATSYRVKAQLNGRPPLI
jgi:hypothetical protein